MNLEENKVFQNRVLLANLPTKIEMLKKTSEKFNKKIYIKRDDQTGTELSGNKIRKLEFAIGEALSQGADTLITCGGIQSNHCRATAAAAAKLGLQCQLVLSRDEKSFYDGNYLMDLLLGAQIHYLPSKEFADNRTYFMEDLAKGLEKEGKKGYIIPVGASNGIGTFGYYQAMQEIVNQEKQIGITFDTVVCTVGSGGTYGGLCLGNKIHHLSKKIVGLNISASAEHFTNEIQGISREFYSYLDSQDSLDKEDICIVDGNVGRGYALNTPEELAFLHEFAKTEGILLDPVYTGKAMRGMYRELEDPQGVLKDSQNVLFIHTGGLYGLFPKRHQFEL